VNYVLAEAGIPSAEGIEGDNYQWKYLIISKRKIECLS